MSATATPMTEKPRRFEPVSDAVVLAAIDRAEVHRERGEGASMENIADHLGFVYNAWTSRRLRPQLDALIDAGVLERVRLLGFIRLVLTEKGRARAAQARQAVALPESPQHRAWRQTRRTAVERIGGVREDARQAVQDAGRLLDAEEVDSDAWFALAERLREALQNLGCATYCAREWAEPDDTHADTDDDRPPWHRPSRRSTRGWDRSTRRDRVRGEA